MSTQVIRDLFCAIPPQEAKLSQGFLDHCAEYVSSAEGCRDTFDWLSHAARTCEILTLSGDIGRELSRIKDVFETAGLGLSCPQLIAHSNQVVRSLTQLAAVQTARAVKEVVFHSLLLVNTVMRAVLFANGAQMLSLAARHVVRVNVLLSVTALVTDGSDLIRDWLEWQVEGKSSEQDLLAWLNVMKNASSVAVSALLLVAYTWSIALAEPVLAGCIFTLSSLYLISKVSAYFYNKMVVEVLSVVPTKF